ncbi:MAG TPA: CHAP domain-containing protein [Chthonomonadaceae bacterium]|nr:CHAP domain-containing protein [Chthonomonadaceae bacterium]
MSIQSRVAEPHAPENELSSDLGVRAVLLAAQSVGVREEPPGSNWGRAVKVYLASVGIATPAPWCAAFVNYKIHQAAQQLGVTTDWPRTGYCPTIAAWAKRNRRFLALPQPGCVFLVRDSAGRYRHTGFVSEVHADGTVSTVEGNSNDTGSAEGIGVFSLRRSTARLRFVRIA